MTMKPHAETRLAKFVAQRISDLQGCKNQVEIAAEAGYERQQPDDDQGRCLKTGPRPCS